MTEKLRCKFCGDIIRVQWGRSISERVLSHIVNRHFEDVEP